MQPMSSPSLPPDTHIVIDENGMYRWRGTIDLRSNPTMSLLIAKVLGIILGMLLAIFVGIIVLSDISDLGRILSAFGIFAGVSALVAVITVVSYRIYVAVIGGTYSADYVMDDTGLMFRPAPKEAAVTKNIAVGTAVVSALAGNLGVTAASIAAMNTESASIFASVRKVKGIRRHRCIKVSSLMLFNQVYVAPEDYDFVYGFISSHCPKARCFEV